jgi:hypothetical protein
MTSEMHEVFLIDYYEEDRKHRFTFRCTAQNLDHAIQQWKIAHPNCILLWGRGGSRK